MGIFKNMGGNVPSGSFPGRSFPDTEKFTMLLNFIRSFYFSEHLKRQFIHNWYSFEGVLMVLNFKDTLTAFGDFKNKQKNVWIFWKYIQYTIHWDKTQMLKKFLRTKQTVQKIPSFFFGELQLISFISNLWF